MAGRVMQILASIVACLCLFVAVLTGMGMALSEELEPQEPGSVHNATCVGTPDAADCRETYAANSRAQIELNNEEFEAMVVQRQAGSDLAITFALAGVAFAVMGAGFGNIRSTTSGVTVPRPPVPGGPPPPQGHGRSAASPPETQPTQGTSLPRQGAGRPAGGSPFG